MDLPLFVGKILDQSVRRPLRHLEAYGGTKEFGIQEFESGLRWIHSRLRSGIRFKFGDIVAEGSKVCIMAESFAETLGGRPFNNLYHIYFQIENGRIVYAREYNDTAHVFSTLRAAT